MCVKHGEEWAPFEVYIAPFAFWINKEKSNLTVGTPETSENNVWKNYDGRFKVRERLLQSEEKHPFDNVYF